MVDFDNYSNWNPFIINIDGKANEGEAIKVTISLPFKLSMDFKWKVETVTDGSEMICLGQTLAPNILDGEHFLRVESLGDNHTRFSQRESIMPNCSFCGSTEDKATHFVNHVDHFDIQ